MAKTYRELTVFGEPETLESLISRLESHLKGDWSRDRQREKELRCISADQAFFFLCCSNAERPAAVLGMLLYGRRLWVTNIASQEQGTITLSQYNAVLVEFYLRFLHPAAVEAGLTVQLSFDDCEELTIEAALHQEVFRRLKSFVLCAEGFWSKPSWSHPLDQERLFAVLVEAHRHSNKIDIGLLREWLVNDRNWPPNKVEELLCEIEFGSEFLDYIRESLYPLAAHHVLTSKSAPGLPSHWARMLGTARWLVTTAFKAIRPVVGHARQPRSPRQAPAHRLPA
jgi:hypothetical protein